MITVENTGLVDQKDPRVEDMLSVEVNVSVGFGGRDGLLPLAQQAALCHREAHVRGTLQAFLCPCLPDQPWCTLWPPPQSTCHRVPLGRALSSGNASGEERIVASSEVCMPPARPRPCCPGRVLLQLLKCERRRKGTSFSLRPQCPACPVFVIRNAFPGGHNHVDTFGLCSSSCEDRI